MLLGIHISDPLLWQVFVGQTEKSKAAKKGKLVGVVFNSNSFLLLLVRHLLLEAMHLFLVVSCYY